MFDFFYNNVQTILSAMGLLAFAMLSNIFLSIWYNVKNLKQSFSLSKLLEGLLKIITLCIGIGFLTLVVTFLPQFLEEVGLVLTDELQQTISVFAIVGLFANSTIKYSKQAYETLSNILQ